MLLKSNIGKEGFKLFDQFDSPFVHDAFVRAGDGRICQGPVRKVDAQGYHLPYEVHRSAFALGSRVATYWAHGYGPIGGGFRDAGRIYNRTIEGFHAALDQLAEKSDADLIVWPYFPMQARELGWLKSWLSGRGINAGPLLARKHERAFLDCRYEIGSNSPSDAGLVLSRNKRKTLGRQARRLKELGQVHFASTRHGLDCETALAAFLKTEASGWKAQKGTALAVNEALHQFVEGFLPQMVADGSAQIDLMMLDDHCIGSLISFRAGRGLFTWKTGMDDVYKRFSPGVHILLEASHQAIADTSLDYVDSLADAGHPVAEHLWAGRREYAQLFIPLNRFGHIASHSLRAGSAGKASARYWAKRALGRV